MGTDGIAGVRITPEPFLSPPKRPTTDHTAGVLREASPARQPSPGATVRYKDRDTGTEEPAPHPDAACAARGPGCPRLRGPASPPGSSVAGPRSPRAAGAALTRAGLAEMFLQQRLLQQELEPAGLRRGAGPAGGGRLPVRRLRAHPAPAAATPGDAARLQPDTRTGRGPGTATRGTAGKADALRPSRIPARPKMAAAPAEAEPRAPPPCAAAPPANRGSGWRGRRRDRPADHAPCGLPWEMIGGSWVPAGFSRFSGSFSASERNTLMRVATSLDVLVEGGERVSAREQG